MFLHQVHSFFATTCRQIVNFIDINFMEVFLAAAGMLEADVWRATRQHNTPYPSRRRTRRSGRRASPFAVCGPLGGAGWP